MSVSRHRRRASDHRAAQRDRVVTNRWVIVGAAVLAGFLVGTFAWNRTGADPIRYSSPDWSPDGSRLVFAAHEAGGPGELYVMLADGTAADRVMETPDDERMPAFSPDGQHLAFVTDRDGNDEIYVVNVDGTDVRRVTRHTSSDRAPAWFPDGTRLVFMSDRHRPEFDLYAVAVDGSGLRRLTREGGNGFPRVAPAGDERVAFQADGQVHVLHVGTGQVAQLTGESGGGLTPSWSPDGERMAFVATRNGRAEIFTMAADGSDARLLVSIPQGGAIEPRWSPAGTHLAFVHEPDGWSGADGRPGTGRALYVVDIGTGRMTRLTR